MRIETESRVDQKTAVAIAVAVAGSNLVPVRTKKHDFSSPSFDQNY